MIRNITKPRTSQVLTTYLMQTNLPSWTSYFVKYKDVQDDQWGLANFNWKVQGINYQILRTGCYPFIKYHCSKAPHDDLRLTNTFFRVIKIINLGLPCLLYGLIATFLISHKDIVHTNNGDVIIYFLLEENKGSSF